MSGPFGFVRGKLILPPVHLTHLNQVRPVMALDTGARLSVITPRVAQELGFTQEELEPEVRIVGATGSAAAAMLRVGSVSVCGQAIKNVRMLCHQLSPTLRLDGILGLSVLKYFNIEIDHKNESATLEKWADPGIPGTVTH
jgi:predicted aspartyl protease